jgi:hypothetical protein
MPIDHDAEGRERLPEKLGGAEISKAFLESMAWRAITYSVVSMVFLAFAPTASAQSVIPAGTLLQCTLDEPNFSSATVNVEDPVVCYLKSVQEFGHIVLPRGSYLQGHVTAEKDPGHFWGKGSLSLEFDRIGMPSLNIPVPSKVIAASGGFKTDRDGDVLGKGHARRDAVEWMLPPLWPWKVISLPARGPRPTFKGEEVLTLRLMDDIVVPKMADVRPALMPGWHYFGDEPARQLQDKPPYHNPSPASFTGVTQYGPQDANASQAPTTIPIVLKSSEVFGVASYRIEHGRLNYMLAGGTAGSADVNDVDWMKTSEMNAGRATTDRFVSRAD